MDRLESKQVRAIRRRLHVRRIIAGTALRPRLTVSKSLRNVTAQLIDDGEQRTLAYCSTLSEGVKSEQKMSKTEAARRVGKAIGKMALEKGIKQAVFDRNKNRYHGRIKAVAEGAREAGLVI
ncbi:MAG: 50S ribosomal protein L18 [candidate division Zixibacteria bacterium]|nr:50S ribosomal protein L18 [candidate division Zixibacteria bacterium]